VVLNKVSNPTITISNNNAGSVVGNRMALPGGASFNLTANGTAILWYDSTLTKWVVIAKGL